MKNPTPSRASAALLALAVSATAARGKVYLTQDEALRIAFGDDAKVEHQSIFLTEAQLARSRQLAGRDIEIGSALVTRYVGERNGKPTGYAYFDTHRVRTLQETLMVVVGPDGRVLRTDVLSFGEPPEYLPKKSWLEQFRGRNLDPELAIKRSIHGITGATMSADAALMAVRRILAIHRAVDLERAKPVGPVEGSDR